MPSPTNCLRCRCSGRRELSRPQGNVILCHWPFDPNSLSTWPTHQDGDLRIQVTPPEWCALKAKEALP